MSKKQKRHGSEEEGFEEEEESDGTDPKYEISRLKDALDDCRNDLRKRDGEVNALYDSLAKCQGREQSLKLQFASLVQPSRDAIGTLVELYNAALERINYLEEIYQMDADVPTPSPSEEAGILELAIPAHFLLTAENLNLVAQRAETQLMRFQHLRDAGENAQDFDVEPEEV